MVFARLRKTFRPLSLTTIPVLLSIALYFLYFLDTKMAITVTNMVKKPTKTRIPFVILKRKAGSLPGIETRVLVRARLASSPE